MADDNISLKEVLLSVSHKLDRFLEAHASLHTEMTRQDSIRGAQLEAMLARQEKRDEKVESLEAFRDEVKGQIKILKWAASGGLLSVAALIAKLLGIPVP